LSSIRNDTYVAAVVVAVVVVAAVAVVVVITSDICKCHFLRKKLETQKSFVQLKKVDLDIFSLLFL